MTTDTAASDPAAKVESHASTAPNVGYPNGHLGHLTQHEETQFAAFKTLLENKGLYKPGPPASHDDPTLLRYLRARGWVPEDAFTQFKDTEEWRAANDIDVLYRTIEHEAYEQSRRLYPQWLGRCDRRGIPVYLFEVKTLDAKTIANYEKLGRDSSFSKAKLDGKTPAGMLRLFALYENLTHFNQPFSTQLLDREYNDTPITLSTNIVDISGVSLKQFWNLKSHMQAASQLATAHYPETLDRVFIIGAPVFFSTVWGWIKRWFDPITVSKIFILSPHEVRPTLEQFIEPRNIPKQYGGELDFTFGDQPTVDPAWEGVVRWEPGHDRFRSRPALWRETADGARLECVGVGSVGGVEQNELICSVPKVWPPPATAPPAAAAEPTPAATPATKEGSVAEGTQTEPVEVRASSPVPELQKLSLSDTKEIAEKHTEGSTVSPPTGAVA
ncbi:CRAL/TRIO domain-containing protein [Colletotrichum sublineola]|uniref:Putative CRAL/TRIO domain-containing protein n=1 Tax=Colletotrichum sublineola TaxID=1173701 RepID=A0A066X4Q9_COLSU|nr:CRAL/TRIO domain-containing protein [Colletotrichum sublineola]KDN60696.1 putative CRAL/TRIO domain-containing protein [Colletotrichum sublineola]